MGFLFKDCKGRSPNFYIGYRLADGRWRKVSAKTPSPAKAKLILQSLEATEAMIATGSATEEQIRKVMAQAIERITGRKPSDPLVGEWLNQWLTEQRGTVSAKTFERYSQVVRDLKSSLGPACTTRLRLVKEEMLLAHRDRLLSLGCSPVTVNQAFKTLADIFGAAQRKGVLDFNPAKIKGLKTQKSDRRPFTPEQIARLLANAQGDMFGLVLLGAFTGQRLMDIATLKWNAVDLAAGTIRFHQKKGDKELLMPIHPQVADYLLAHAGDDPDVPVLPELAHKKGAGATGLSMLFSQLMERARIEAPVVRFASGKRGRTTRALSFHSLRYSFNSQLANGSVSQELRQRLTGHTSKAMNDVYTSIELETLRSAVESVPAIPSLRFP